MQNYKTKEQTGVIIVGAGFAGVGLAVQLERQGRSDYLMLERGSTVGGAWRDNTYPGAECDVPSHLYSYSFALNPNWTKMHAPQPEILDYIEQVAEDEGVLPQARFNTNVEEIRWDEELGRWQAFAGDKIFEAPALIMAVGYLSDAKMPDIEGLDQFEGEMFHSAEWNHSIDLTGKRVAVIGSGASAIQIIPEVAKEAAHLYSFQRSAAYVTPRHDPHYTEAQKRMFARKPELMEQIRADLFWANEERYAQRRGTKTLIETVTRAALAHLENQVSDLELREKLTPDYTIGCKRILKSNDYFPTFLQENVSLVTGGVSRLTRAGVVASDGTEYPVDVVIAATGFEATDIPLAQHVRGRYGQTLKERWHQGMEAYKTTAVSGFPNLWFIKGPNTGLGHNSAIYIAEAQIDYVLKALAHVERGEILEVQESEQEKYMSEVERLSEGTVWLSGGCRSWYVDPRSGRLTTLWPDFSFTFREVNTPFEKSVYDVEKSKALV